MVDEKQGGNGENNGEDNNLLPLETDDPSVLSPDSLQAIQTLGAEITRLEQLGEEGLPQIRLLLDTLGETVFSTGERVIGRQQEQTDFLPPGLIKFAERNLELFVRTTDINLLKDEDLVSSMLSFILREAEEDYVVAHALAAVGIIRQGSTDDLRTRGQRAYELCLNIARTRGFGPRVESLIEDKHDGSG